jgi:hypothetical protein
MPRLFVAAATHRNITNLPLILKLADPGDRLAWLLSPQARKGRWVERVSPLLQNAGLEV